MSFAAPVGIPEIEPESAVIFEDAPNFTKDSEQVGDVGFGGRFEADLIVEAERATKFACFAILEIFANRFVMCARARASIKNFSKRNH